MREEKCRKCGATITAANWGEWSEGVYCAPCDTEEYQRVKADAEARAKAEAPTVVVVRFVNTWPDGNHQSPAQNATAFMRRYQLTRTNLLFLVNEPGVLYYTLEVPAALADQIAAEGQGEG